MAVLVCALAAAADAPAASLADVKARARAVGISPGSGGAGERAALDRLGELAFAFLDAVDRGERSGATAAYEAVATPLERSYEAHRAALDRLSKSVIAADGDMDALYESSAWQEHQLLATQALYYLNWLYYRGATIQGGSKRRALLDKAAAGFSEFATASGTNPVIAESQLGRGLTYLELDQVDWAIADFEAVVKAEGASPERVRKAWLALAESYIKAGRSSDALRASSQALRLASAGDRPRAELTRARALLMAAAATPSKRTSYQAEARDLLGQLQAAGGPWGSRARQIVRAGLDNPKIWAGPKAKAPPPPPTEWETTKQLVASGKLSRAIPRLEKVLASSDAEDRANQREARYLLGLARFRTGKISAAAEDLAAVIAAGGTAYYMDDAAYLHFKARESLYAGDPTPERLPAYEQAIRTLLERHPDHKAAPEARFRLGELRQRAERYAEAAAEYAKVRGDPAFEAQAAFARAQSVVKILEQTPEDAEPDPARRAEAAEALDTFRSLVDESEVERLGDTPIEELRGQAALMSAYLAAVSETPDYARALEWLEGFEERYPMLEEQQLAVSKLRLVGVARLGRLGAAAEEAARPIVAELDPALLDELAGRFLTKAARAKAAGDEADVRAGKRAARLLSEHALASPEIDTLAAGAQRRLRSTLAALYEEEGMDDEALALYRDVLERTPDSVAARAGAARLLEADGAPADARRLWDEIVSEPGRAGWLEASYQSARLSLTLGEPARACTTLRAVPTEMLTRTQTPRRQKIQELLRTACAPA